MADNRTLCRACGKDIPAWNYCANCGTALDDETQEEIDQEQSWAADGPHIGAPGATGNPDDYTDLQNDASEGG